MKILLIAGHGAGDPGACAVHSGVTYRESELTRELAGMIRNKLAGYCQPDLFDTTKNAYKEHLAGRLTKQVFRGYDYVLELHFNASSGSARGVECYVTTKEKGTTVEDGILKNVAGAGFQNRGVKRRDFSVIERAKSAGVSSALLEVCFMDSAKDMGTYTKDREKVAQAVAHGIISGFRLKKRQVKLQQFGAGFGDIQHVECVYGQKETVTQAAKRITWNGKSATVVQNAELYHQDLTPASGVVQEHGVKHVTQTHGFAFTDGNPPVLSYANQVGAKNWISGYPLLLRDNVLAFENTPGQLEGKRGRSALGLSDTHFAFFYVKESDGCTLEDLAAAIRDRGFHTAINLDGGGSVAQASPFVVYDQKRPTCGKIAMWVKGYAGNKLTK